MLESLTIKNVALIKNGMIEFGLGFNCLSGETGSGKSLVVDSLSLLLGEKADKSMISYGETAAVVEAVFSTNNEKILQLMEDLGLEKENTIIISRKITTDGKNECRVNGKMFTLSMLKQITQPLMDLHGQFQHQALLKVANHLPFLDGMLGSQGKQLKLQFANLYAKLKDVNKQLKELTEDDSEREKLIDLYAYQIEEITEANFVVGEEEELKNFHTLVCNQEKIAELLNQSISLLDGDGYMGGIVEKTGTLASNLSSASAYTDKINELAERAYSANVELKDIYETLDDLKDELVLDSTEVEQKEARLDKLNSFKKKYGNSIEEINEYLSKIQTDYDRLINSTEIISELKKEKDQLVSAITECGEKLSQERKLAAKTFELGMKNELSELGMKNAKLEVQFNAKNIDTIDANGFDEVEFLFTANAGVPARPLTKVASGGEMSRLMLAIKNIAAGRDEIETMIFDEIDSGVSGEVAGVMAEKMYSISMGHQIICVSHLPQICAMADHNYYLSKSSDGVSTTTHIEILDENRKVEEVARLTGGKLSELALSHAKELILQANTYKQSKNA